MTVNMCIYCFPLNTEILKVFFGRWKATLVTCYSSNANSLGYWTVCLWNVDSEDGILLLNTPFIYKVQRSMRLLSHTFSWLHPPLFTCHCVDCMQNYLGLEHIVPLLLMLALFNDNIKKSCRGCEDAEITNGYVWEPKETNSCANVGVLTRE